MPRVHNGIYPYSTPYNGIHPYGTYTPNANTGLHPYGTAPHKQAVTDRVVNTAANIQGVTHATAVVSGRDAVIGLDINKGTKNRAMIEREVANAVKKANPGYSVHVTADRTLHQRIRTLNSQVRSGHPSSRARSRRRNDYYRYWPCCDCTFSLNENRGDIEIQRPPFLLYSLYIPFAELPHSKCAGFEKTHRQR